MQRDGVMRTAPFTLSDTELSDTELRDATDALVRHRSVDALAQEHRRHVTQRNRRRRQAVETLSDAGELAPVLGLAGTLIALSQLAGGTPDTGALTSAVGQAVVSTLYGLLFAHLLFLPLSAAVARRGRQEDIEREGLIRWLIAQLAPACPPDRTRDAIAGGIVSGAGCGSGLGSGSGSGSGSVVGGGRGA